MKVCSICKAEKCLDEFHWQNKSQGKVMSACKMCNMARQRSKRLENPELQRKKDRASYQRNKEHRIEYARRYRRERPEKTRETNLKVKYGITIAHYDKMFEAQGGKCKICQSHQGKLKRALCVDHCHDTGRVRGLLCDTCNKFLGFYEKFRDECEDYLNDG